MSNSSVHTTAGSLQPASDRGPVPRDACQAFSEAAGQQRSDMKQGTCSFCGLCQDRETVSWTHSQCGCCTDDQQHAALDLQLLCTKCPSARKPVASQRCQSQSATHCCCGIAACQCSWKRPCTPCVSANAGPQG